MHSIRQYELGGPEVLVGARFALSDASGGHRALEARKTHGKVVLIPDALP